MSGDAPNLDSELLDDFFAECDEHLGNIRQLLAQLENSVGKPQVDRKVVEELFREFHSLKGISAIAGLQPSEKISHAIEDVLRDLTRQKLAITRSNFEVLMVATQRLEQIVYAFRSRQPIPQHQKILDQLGSICTPPPAVEEQAPKPAGASNVSATDPLLEEARARGLILWKVAFTPSRELDLRGININSVRARLAQAGEIFQAVPTVLPGGGIAFQFHVGSKEIPPDIALWEEDGMRVEIEEQETAADAASLDATVSGPLPANPFIAPSHFVRVDMNRLDDLIRITGEMVIQQSRFEKELGQFHGRGQVMDTRKLEEINTGFSKSLRELREAIMRVRLVSVAEIFARMPFVVRDLAGDAGKKVSLQLEGQNTEIDKYLIEQLKDPLLHIVRNAVSHGVESPEERVLQGKPEHASILLKASAAGDSVIIQVRDDGRGIQRKKIAAQTKKLGIPVPSVLDNNALLQILCAPGFSSREDADRASGRGVGMAVVQTKIRELGGSMSLESEEGKGTQFTLRLPLTLAVAETIIVSAADQTCAVPQGFISEVIQVEEKDLKIVNRVEVVPYRSGVLPVVRLASLFNQKENGQARRSLLVLSSERGSAGLLVEKIHGQKQVVVRALRDPLIQVPAVTGATELGDGKPVLILDCSTLTSGAVRPREGARAEVFDK